MATPSNPSEYSTIIGPDARFKGELAFDGGVRVDGQFEGSIKTSGGVLISKSGKLKATIEAGTISVEGSVEGNLFASDRVELNASCDLKGDVKAKKLLVKEGASFVGHCEVGANVAKSPAPSVPTRQIADAAAGKK